ncbi:Polyphosphate kinase [compost metagenome]
METIQGIVDSYNVKKYSRFSRPELYTNRELSWLQFNWRVLHHAIRKDVPLLERFNFLGITASNLDEFIMVRFSSVINKVMRDDMTPDLSGMLPHEEYLEILSKIKHFKGLQNDGYVKLWNKIKKHGVELVKVNDLNKSEKEQVHRIFTRQIYPLLTPITFDSTKAFPIIKSGQLCTIVCLEDDINPNLNVLSIIPIDPSMKRIYEVKTKEGVKKLILLEDIIRYHLDKVFVNKKIVYTGEMRILREADIEIDRNRSIYIVDRMRQTLRRRELSRPIFMDVDQRMPKHMIRLLTKIFDIDKNHVFKAAHNIDMTFLKNLPIDIPQLRYKSFRSQHQDEMVGEVDMFTAMDSGDIILHHPYDSFDPVIKFLEHAAEDKEVRAIKQTLYRVSSSDSPIVEALCRAAKKGKQVSVLLEIKARFDEGRNISLIEKMETAGCKLIYGAEDLKTHCKFILVVRETPKGLKEYCHVGTGNYNEKSASVYTDLSYFTCNTKICDDLIAIFNILSGFSEPKDTINKVFYAPYNIRTKLYAMIDREKELARKGKPASIILKLNSLSDKGIIERLYEAANEGVRISIICRGICSMKSIHKNISIRSIVGRYLEHSRIYYFHNNGKVDLFISSADMLSRNLDRRVELMVPIVDNEVKDHIMNILGAYFKDTHNTYFMNSLGEYIRHEQDDDAMDVQTYFMKAAIGEHGLKRIVLPFMKKKRT